MFYRKHKRVQLKCKDDSLTIQSARQECDINYILKKHAQTGILDHVKKTEGVYDNFLSAPDFHQAMNQLRRAEESFMLLPSDIRLTFNNNPAEFLEFAQDPENLPEMVEMGLATKRPEPPKKEPDQAPPKIVPKKDENLSKPAE